MFSYDRKNSLSIHWFSHHFFQPFLNGEKSDSSDTIENFEDDISPEEISAILEETSEMSRLADLCEELHATETLMLNIDKAVQQEFANEETEDEDNQSSEDEDNQKTKNEVKQRSEEIVEKSSDSEIKQSSEEKAKLQEQSRAKIRGNSWTKFRIRNQAKLWGDIRAKVRGGGQAKVRGDG